MNALRVLWNAETVVGAEARVRWDLAPVFCFRGYRDRFSPGRRRKSGSLQLGRRPASSVVRLLQRHTNTARAARHCLAADILAVVQHFAVVPGN